MLFPLATSVPCEQRESRALNPIEKAGMESLNAGNTSPFVSGLVDMKRGG